jgi:IS5 family transposase
MQRLGDKSRMSREVQVRFCEGLGVKLPRPTRQYLCGEEFFRHDLPFERSSLTRWRQRMGAEKLQSPVRKASPSPRRRGR